MASAALPATPQLRAEWHAFSLAPPSAIISEKLSDLIVCCAPKTASERLPYLIMGFTIERMLAHLESVGKSNNFGELFQLYALRLTHRLNQYHHDLVPMAAAHQDFLTTIIHFDMFVTFAIQLISLSLPKEQNHIEMTDSADVAFKRLYISDYWPAGVENTRKALAGLLTLITAANSRLKEEDEICSTDDFLTMANEVQLDLVKLKEGIIELGKTGKIPETEPGYLRPTEVRQRHGIARTTLTYWRNRGLLVKCHQKGRRFEYNEEEVIELIRRKKKNLDLPR
ncbi:MAG TPA: hypothetical protein DCR43_01315 [Bacteroidales bacterium]|nr:MAG: hypothetical protein A2X11_11630 [Bacteroidetes bacterium GWE2_42_24]HAQ64490.1 hypothetical protein [Bacteroidales bacterium]HBZ67354.1 hypothetical protein [Bacteroidales bacterium]